MGGGAVGESGGGVWLKNADADFVLFCTRNVL